MSIAILSTGDELVSGDTLNTNGHVIAQHLTSDGLPVGMHLACRDKERDIVSCLAFLTRDHDTIILTGGLGPTSDDRTRFALARFLNEDLIEFASALDHITERLTKANLVCNAGNRQQALFPADAILLPNPNGTALGCYYSKDNKRFILLPGPPSECLPMFNHYVLPDLQLLRQPNIRLLKWRLFGVAEGAIAQILDDALAHLACETGYRLETPYVEFKVRCDVQQIDMIKDIIEPLVAPYIISPPEQKASEQLRLKIDELQKPIVIFDEATGGVLQTLLQRPSNKATLQFYKNESAIKVETIYFHLSGLDDYWLQKTSAVTQVNIAYHSAFGDGSETHPLAFRNQWVIYHAAEWLSFRLLHLINQLHERIA